MCWNYVGSVRIKTSTKDKDLEKCEMWTSVSWYVSRGLEMEFSQIWEKKLYKY